MAIGVLEVLQMLSELLGVRWALSAHICVYVLLTILFLFVESLLDLVLVELVEYRVVILS